MNDPHEDFVNRLLEAESSVPTEHYRNELKRLIESPLTPVRKFASVASIVGGLAFAAWLGFMLISKHSKQPIQVSCAWVVGIAGSLAWAAINVGILRRGHFRRRIDLVRLTSILFFVWVLACALGAPLALSLADKAAGTQALLILLFFMGATSLFWMRTLLEQTELRIREKLLETELQLHRLAERTRLQSRQKPDE